MTRKVGHPSIAVLRHPGGTGDMASACTGQCPSHTRMNGPSPPPRGEGTRSDGCLLALSLQRAAGLAAATSKTRQTTGVRATADARVPSTNAAREGWCQRARMCQRG